MTDKRHLGKNMKKGKEQREKEKWKYMTLFFPLPVLGSPILFMPVKENK
jgi:hypothetical protein